jgi:hypothetical protein
MSIDYAWEKFGKAVSCLAASPESLKWRVSAAFAYHLRLLQSSQLDELPEVRDQFVELMKELRKANVTADPNSTALGDYELSKIAERIFEMFLKIVAFDAVDRHKKDLEPRKNFQSGNGSMET